MPAVAWDASVTALRQARIANAVVASDSAAPAGMTAAQKRAYVLVYLTRHLLDITRQVERRAAIATAVAAVDADINTDLGGV